MASTAREAGLSAADVLRARGERLARVLEQLPHLGPPGVRAALERLTGASGFDRVLIVAAFAALADAESLQALRGELADRSLPSSRDSRCAAVAALAQRLQDAGTADFVAALDTDPDAHVRSYAAHALAQHGDASAVDAVQRWLLTRLRRPRARGVVPSEVGIAVTVLLRHGALPADLVWRLRRAMPRMPETDVQWARRWWPGLLTADGTLGAPPDARQLRAWASTPAEWEL